MRVEGAGENAAAIWMREALAMAEAAEQAGEVPIGAVVVAGDRMIAAARNRTIGDCDPTAHAEILALREAARRLGNHRLSGAVLYVTVEPCIMCAGAVVQARLAAVVFGCRDPKAGALGSVYDVSADARLNHRFEVAAGVEADACRALLQRFFRARRT
jgi:tRNA(adenine34) deaminase